MRVQAAWATWPLGTARPDSRGEAELPQLVHQEGRGAVLPSRAGPALRQRLHLHGARAHTHTLLCRCGARHTLVGMVAVS